MAHPSERIACDAKSALGPPQKRASSVATSQKRLASDTLSALRPSSSALTNSQERIASDAQSALWSSLPRSTQFNTLMLRRDRWRKSSLGQRHHLPAHRSHTEKLRLLLGCAGPHLQVTLSMLVTFLTILSSCYPRHPMVALDRTLRHETHADSHHPLCKQTPICLLS